MAQYKTGTVSVTTGDQTVTGTGTLWVANVNPGDGFTVAGTGIPYTVASVTNDASLTLSAPYQGATASGKSYAIYRDFTTNNSYPELSQGDIETATIWTRALRLIDGDVVAIEADYYNTGNILGPVSQSAGVPTGAIIERGSNANGEWTKFADGTMICETVTHPTINHTAISTETDILRSDSINISWPVTFIVPPTPSLSVVSFTGEPVFVAWPAANPSTDSEIHIKTDSYNKISTCIIPGGALPSEVRIRASAVGRWY